MTRKAWAAGFLALLILACAVPVALRWQGNDTKTYYRGIVKHSTGTAPYTWPGGAVNVNTADASQLQTLEGISTSQIKALIEDRGRNGAFDFPEDLIYVRGIGEKTLEKILGQLDFSWLGN